MSTALAELRHIFGLNSEVSRNISHHDEQTIVYPSGSNCVLYNIDQRSQRFIPCPKSEGVTALCISTNRRYVAIAECNDKPTITVYDLHSLRKRKVLSFLEIGSDRYVHMAFSPDSKYLAAQGGKPDWIVTYWTWEKSKVLASIKTTNHVNASVYQVSFNPQDNTQICVIGNGIFKHFRYSEGALKLHSTQKLEPQNFLCHAWVADDRVLVGSSSGKLFLFDIGDLKMEINLAELLKREQTKAIDSQSSNFEITYIFAYSKGFAAACGRGSVHLFEKTEEREQFKRVRELRIPQDPNTTDPIKSQQQKITCISISPSEETLIISTDISHLYFAALSSNDIGKQGEIVYMEVLSQSFHHGQVTGLDICIRKPLIATCSVDHSVRIWNYETCILETYKEFAEEASSIALHPSGLYILVGFSDKLRLMNILIDDIRMFKEFAIRGCRECFFSNGGHLFAAVNGNIIHIYSTTSYDNIMNLKGHNGKVRSVIWSLDDSKMISCGMDGAVYEWDTFTGKRLGESVLKHCSYTGVALSPDIKTTFAVGTDKTLKEIADSTILREMPTQDTVLTSVALSRTGRMLFVGTQYGTMWSVRCPLTIPGEWMEYQGHGKSITKMKLTPDDQYLITISEDATVIVWKVTDREGRGLKRDKEIGWAEEILITKSDLEEKNSIMSELKTRVEELKMENDYQLRLKDMNYNEKIKELTEKFIQEMESLKTKNQVLKTDKDKEEAKHEEEVLELKEKNAKELQDLESANNQKLMLEYEKFQEQQTKIMKMQEDYERQLQEMEESKERALEELTEYYDSKLHDMTVKLEQSNDESRQQNREYEETKRQIEEDADCEILDIKTRYEMKLRDEKDTNMRLKGETGIMKKKFTSLQKEIEDHKEEIKKFHIENQKLTNIIKNLEKDISGLKKEIQERDETIQDKEKRIYDLKKKNQELEKFKFVLDYKIKELKKQIEPRENDIKNMKEQIQEMESELERFHKQNTDLVLDITELRQKLKATDMEMHQERQKVRDVEALVKRFKTDLHNCVGYIQDPKMLKESIKALYQKHVQEDITESASVDADIQKEYSRQREHLERSVASIRKKLSKDSELHRADNVRIMQENVMLIKEINDLRKELKMSRTQIHDLEAIIGLHTKNTKSDGPKQMTTKGPPAAILQRTLAEKEKVVHLQRLEIEKLHDQVYEMEEIINQRVPSATHLPPVELQ